MTTDSTLKVIVIEYECNSCAGTGLYVGIGEQNGLAVQCYNCDGTGKAVHRFEYREFTGRKDREGITHVILHNLGFVLTPEIAEYAISVEDWKAGNVTKAEDRRHTCPAWWYQSVDYNKKPKWTECISCGVFSSCKHFQTKEKCWERWDKEFSV